MDPTYSILPQIFHTPMAQLRPISLTDYSHSHTQQAHSHGFPLTHTPMVTLTPTYSQTTAIPTHSRHTPMVSLSLILPWLPSHLHTHRKQPFPYIAGTLPWLPSHSHSHGYPLTYTLTFSHQANKAKHYINITECTSKIHIWHN